jgi:iron-regulated transporter 1
VDPPDESNGTPWDETTSRKTRYRLYLSHWLSTWNTRVFEFGAVLYLAKAYPGTLLTMSMYAFVRGLSAIVCASAIGTYIDRNDRLQVVRTSIGERGTLVRG